MLRTASETIKQLTNMIVLAVFLAPGIAPIVGILFSCRLLVYMLGTPAYTTMLVLSACLAISWTVMARFVLERIG